MHVMYHGQTSLRAVWSSGVCSSHLRVVLVLTAADWLWDAYVFTLGGLFNYTPKEAPWCLDRIIPEDIIKLDGGILPPSWFGNLLHCSPPVHRPHHIMMLKNFMHAIRYSQLDIGESWLEGLLV